MSKAKQAVIATVIPTQLAVQDEDPFDSAHYKSRDCGVYIINEDCIEVVIRITGQDLKRFKSRMTTQNWALYLWENVFKRAIQAHIY